MCDFVSCGKARLNDAWRSLAREGGENSVTPAVQRRPLTVPGARRGAVGML
ncbi:hypothetical protein HMPREF1868_00884 [Olsenella sp. DNF00959]|nr:hypothetical protein HMPREF1868_00884 [Olsenella sp. DNF00959]